MSSPSDQLFTNSSSLSDTTSSKRKASVAGLDGTTTTRPVKRRASKACQCCRARKVRCNVTEHGAPCTNCRLDEVECIVSESRRKKKWNKDGATTTQPTRNQEAVDTTAKGRKIVSRGSVGSQSGVKGMNANSPDSHVPHSIYQQSLSLNSNVPLTFNPSTPPTFPILQPSPISTGSNFFSPGSHFPLKADIPYFIKPLPPRIGPDEIAYLTKKGVLTVPVPGLRNELLKAYIEFVHPYMPVLDLCDFVKIVDSNNGSLGRISLILYQAVMFAGSAFIDMQHLYNAGYSSRKHARRDFFQRTRLLYDFDYESDRVSLVQALLLLTYYYETPDDQKDTWHWMGVATSVAHTIGLHRNPERSSMDAKKTKLWKRIWWSTYMRDRLIALGMRRPTRIKDEDYDVPMITLDDFEIEAIPDDIACVPADCVIARDVEKQRELAILCIQKAKLCLCISTVLSKQYCVLNNNQGVANDRTTMMLLPKKLDPETSEVRVCDDILQVWLDELPEEAGAEESFTGNASLDLNRALLHMVYYTTVSALHRPQVFPASQPVEPQTPGTTQILEWSRIKVREAAQRITSLAQALDSAGLVKYLPTTGVTVLLPAIIIHLLDIKAPEEETRRASLRGFCQCMNVVYKLRDMYAAADYSIAFLDAAVRKAGIQVSTLAPTPSTESSSKMHPVMTVEDLLDAGRRLDMLSMPPPPSVHGSALTPPPDAALLVSGFAAHHNLLARNGLPGLSLVNGNVTDDEVARRLETFLASTPPASEHSSGASSHEVASLAATGTTMLDVTTNGGLGEGERTDQWTTMMGSAMMPELENDEFDALLDLDGMGEKGLWAFDDGGVHGFTHDMDWLAAGGMDGKGTIDSIGVDGAVV